VRLQILGEAADFVSASLHQNAKVKDFAAF